LAAQPGTASRPYPINAQSNSIQVGWEEPKCDGGHNIVEYNLEYYRSKNNRGSIVIISGITQTNYTVNGLKPSTSYAFRVNTVTAEGIAGSQSRIRHISTLATGIYNICI